MTANSGSVRVNTLVAGSTSRQSFTELIAASSKQKGKSSQDQSSKSTSASSKQPNVQITDVSTPTSEISKALAQHQIGLDNAPAKGPDAVLTAENPMASFQVISSLPVSGPDVACAPQSNTRVQSTLSIPGLRVGTQLSLTSVMTASPAIQYTNVFSAVVSNAFTGRVGRSGDLSPGSHVGQKGIAGQAFDLDTSHEASLDAADKTTEQNHPAPSVARLEQDLPAADFTLEAPQWTPLQIAKPAAGSESVQPTDLSSANSSHAIDPAFIAMQSLTEAAPIASLQPSKNSFAIQPMPIMERVLPTQSATVPVKAAQAGSSEENHSAPSVSRPAQNVSAVVFASGKPVVEYAQTVKPSVGSVSLPASSQSSPNIVNVIDSTSKATQTATEATPILNAQPGTNPSANVPMPIFDSGLPIASAALPVNAPQGVANTNVQASRRPLPISKDKQSEAIGGHSESERKADARNDFKDSDEGDDAFSVGKESIGTASSHHDTDAGSSSSDAAPMQHNASASQQVAPLLPDAAQSGLPQVAQTAGSVLATVVPPHTQATNASQQVQDLPAVNSAQLIQSLHHSEMRLGMQSTEFGSISISTSLNREALSAHISIDHAELGRALTPHLQAIEEKLSSAHGLNARVTVSDGVNENTRGNSGHRSNEHRYQGSKQSAGSATSILEPVAASMSSTTSPAYAQASRLDIRI